MAEGEVEALALGAGAGEPRSNGVLPVPVTYVPVAHEVLASIAAFFFRSVMKSVIRESSAFLTLSWKPHACSEIGLSRPG